MSALKSIRRILSSSRNNDSTQTNIDHQTRKIRILFMGTEDCGKTTMVKQIRKIYQTLSEHDIKMMTAYIQDSVVGYIKSLCYQSIRLKTQYDDNDNIWNVLKKWNIYNKHIVYGFLRQCQHLLPANNIFYTIPSCIYIICMNYYNYQSVECNTKIKAENELLRKEILCLESPYHLTPKLGVQIIKMWTDPGIQNTFILRSKYQIHENVDYFLNHIKRICAENYKSNFDDFIRIRRRTSRFDVHKITANIPQFGEYVLELTDVGGSRPEKKKWTRFVPELDCIDAMLYHVGLSDYDKMCFEDNKTNRLQESINLFQHVVNGMTSWFNGKNVIICFNKYDLFQQKIKIIPISVAFDDYPTTDDSDPNDEDQVVKFIAAKFLQCFNGENVKLAAPLHIYRINALNTKKIDKVFKDITLDLVKLHVKNN